MRGQNLANYFFIDNDLPAADIIYYRLKMIDIDGKFSYSKTLAFRLNNNAYAALVYPNPTAGKLQVKLDKGLSQNSVLTITDVTGQIVWKQQLVTGQKEIGLNVAKLAAGRYFIKIVNNNELINQSFVIIR